MVNLMNLKIEFESIKYEERKWYEYNYTVTSDWVTIPFHEYANLSSGYTINMNEIDYIYSGTTVTPNYNTLNISGTTADYWQPRTTFFPTNGPTITATPAVDTNTVYNYPNFTYTAGQGITITPDENSLIIGNNPLYSMTP